MDRSLNVKVSNNFYLAELLPPELFENPNILPGWYLTGFLAVIPQRMRNLLGKLIVINNWFDGGQYKNSGFRSPSCTEGAPLSMHRFGLAFDVKVVGMTSQEVFDWFKKNSKLMPEITTYERISDTPTWNHFDGRNTGLTTLLEVPGR